MLAHLKAEGHEIHFCYIAREGSDAEIISPMRQAWDKITVIPHDRSAEHPTLPGGVFGVDDWVQPALRGFLQYLSAVETPDVVLVEYVFLSAALTYFPNSIRLIDTHDIFTDRHKKLDAIGLGRSFFYTTLEQEAIGLNRADIIIAIQDNEAIELRKICNANVFTIGYLPSISSRPVVPKYIATTDEPRKVGYIGSVNPINITALREFLGAVDLEVIANLGWRLEVAGTICEAVPASLRLQAEKRGVSFIGVVKDPADFLRSCDLVINPHVGGTGLKIKTVDAMATGRPVVGTMDAFKGIPTVSKWHRFTTAAAMAVEMLELLGDREELAKLASETARVYTSYREYVEDSLLIFRNQHSVMLAAQCVSFLVVTDILFWKRGLGNEARIFELLNSFPPNIRITVFVLKSLSPEDLRQISELNVHIEVVSFREYIAGFDQKKALYIESSKQLLPFESKHFVRAFFFALEKFLAQRSFDFGLVEYVRLSYLRLARGFPKIKIVDTHDIFSMRVSNFSHFGKVHFVDISGADEFQILDKFDFVGCIQERELAVVNHTLPGKALYLPHVVTLPAAVVQSGCMPLAIGFIGGNSPMNLDGIIWFLTHIWPLFAPTGLKLLVGGNVCDALANQDISSQRGVHLLGRVEELDDFYGKLCLAINPVYYGGGVKIKSIEAMSYGVPLVASPEAVFGLEQGAGSAFYIANSRRKFAQAILTLLAEPELRAKIGMAGRNFVEACASPGSIRDTIKNLAQLYGNLRILNKEKRS